MIIDATFPFKKSADCFECYLKVIDPSLKPQAGGAKGKQEWAQVALRARRFEDLPICHRVGDLIRIHRATLQLYKGMRVFQVNVAYKSSWALYSCDKTTPLGVAAGDAPYAFSGKRATMDANDVGIQKSLKKWGPDFFKANNGVPDNKVVKLKDAHKASGSFDVNAKILQVFELDEYTNELKLKDDDKGTVCYTLALKLKFPHLRAGQVVRIRSASYDTTSHSKDVLVL